MGGHADLWRRRRWCRRQWRPRWRPAAARRPSDGRPAAARVPTLTTTAKREQKTAAAATVGSSSTRLPGGTSPSRCDSLAMCSHCGARPCRRNGAERGRREKTAWPRGEGESRLARGVCARGERWMSDEVLSKQYDPLDLSE